MRVFISYVTAEKSIAHKIKRALKEHGFKSFLAHDDIVPTLHWAETILRELDRCDIFVPVLTKGFNTSPWTNQEIGYVLAKCTPIIPIKVDKDPPGFLSRYQAMTYKPSKKFAIGKFIQAINTNEKSQTKYKSLLIKKFCDSDSYEDASKNAALLSNINKLNKKDWKIIMNGTLDNGQISNSFGAKRELVSLFKKYPMMKFPKQLLDDFYDTIHNRV